MWALKTPRTRVCVCVCVCRHEDVDECREYDVRCSGNYSCINTVGSYRCGCKPGFVERDSQCVGMCDPPVLSVNLSSYD